MTVYRCWVRMADNEWSGDRNGQIMPELAREYAERLKDKRPLVINVHEHGGWYHTYLFSGLYPNGLLIGTANDAAQWSAEVRAVWKSLEGATTEHCGDFRRPETPAKGA